MRSKGDLEAEPVVRALAGLRVGDHGHEDSGDRVEQNEGCVAGCRTRPGRDPGSGVVSAAAPRLKSCALTAKMSAKSAASSSSTSSSTCRELEVAHDELLLEPDRDPAPANRSPARPRSGPSGERVAAEVRGLVWIAAPYPSGASGRAPLMSTSKAREETRVVVGEEPGGRDIDVAPLVAAMQNVDPARIVFGTARELTPVPRLRGASRCGFAFARKDCSTPRRVIYGTGSKDCNFSPREGRMKRYRLLAVAVCTGLVVLAGIGASTTQGKTAAPAATQASGTITLTQGWASSPTETKLSSQG